MTHLFGMIAALAVAVAGGTAVAQQVDQPAFLEVDVNTVLRVHPYPSIHAPVTARLPDGIVARNLGCQRGEGRVWCHVVVGNITGWAARDYMIGSGGPITVVHRPAPAVAMASASQGVVHCRVDGGNVNDYCHTDIIRRGNGNATFAIVLPEGGVRHIVFQSGTVFSDGEGELSVTQTDDMNEIDIGADEHFEIPSEMRF